VDAASRDEGIEVTGRTPGREMPSALVTGVSRRRGIGWAATQRLRQHGWTVFTTGWREYDAEQERGHEAVDAVDLQLDLSDPTAPAHLFDAAENAVGHLTALVAIHTVDLGGGLLQVSAESIDRHLAANVRGSLLLMKEFASRFRGEPGSGRIVLFTSGPPQLGAISYAASKGALEWATYSAATELGPMGITVNAINPGPNQTGWMSAEVEQEAASRTPLGRPGRPEDAAALVAFLLSADAGWINGQIITSDGGHSIAGKPFPGPA
jgi:3-oxoacyl-[acyl-carrier protein] reductase